MPRNLSVETSVALGATCRGSPHTSRCTTTSARSRPLLAQIRIGIPIAIAYHRDVPRDASPTELAITPRSPSDRAALAGVSSAAPAAKPMPPTTTSANGSSQMKSR